MNEVFKEQINYLENIVPNFKVEMQLLILMNTLLTYI